MIWEPFDPVSYFLHTIVGTVGVVAAIVALVSLKGASVHKRAGWVFVAAAAVAASTAFVFSLTQASLLVVTSCFMTISLLVGAVLATRERTRAVAVGEGLALLLMGLVALQIWGNVVMWLLGGASISELSMEILYAFFPLGFFAADVRHVFRRGPERRLRAISRHLSRMGFAFAIAVHAPIVSFSDDLGLNPFLAFFGPFVLWPILLVRFNALGRGRRRETAAAS